MPALSRGCVYIPLLIYFIIKEYKMILIRKNKKILKVYLGVMIVVYFVLVAVFAIYYNYLAIVKYGFFVWFGEIVIAWKALFWPYYIFFGNWG
jgi:hypothetical protein